MLPRLVGLDVAKELTWTGRMVSGEEAVAIGLATRVSDDPRTEALALARDLAGSNPYAIRGTKRLLNQSGLVSQEQQFRDEYATIASLIGTPEPGRSGRRLLRKASARLCRSGLTRGSEWANPA